MNEVIRITLKEVKENIECILEGKEVSKYEIKFVVSYAWRQLVSEVVTWKRDPISQSCFKANVLGFLDTCREWEAEGYTPKLRTLRDDLYIRSDLSPSPGWDPEQ